MDIFNLFENKKTHSLKLIPDILKPFEIKQKVILLHGGTTTGKSLYGINIIKQNPDKTFLYIDAFGTSRLDLDMDNAYIFNSNVLEEIEDCLRLLEFNTLDCLIVDGISSLTSSRDTWDTQELRYKIVNDYILSIVTLCSSKNTILFAINTDNAKGINSNLSNKTKESIHTIIKLSDGRRTHDKFTCHMQVEKNLIGTSYDGIIEFKLGE